jgi:hypothetical protein
MTKTTTKTTGTTTKPPTSRKTKKPEKLVYDNFDHTATPEQKATHKILLARANKVRERFHERITEYRIHSRVTGTEIKITLHVVGAADVTVRWEITRTGGYNVHMSAFDGLVSHSKWFESPAEDTIQYGGKLLDGNSRTQATAFADRITHAVFAIKDSTRELIRQLQDHMNEAVVGSHTLRRQQQPPVLTKPYTTTHN